ncbi:MAG: hypothetical protein KR126chlam6_00239 [Candidatus Anoxychlamydiales bacterium]|nr:hypothetical protein [Candidatus Anoxychlamydiales bacterium]
MASKIPVCVPYSDFKAWAKDSFDSVTRSEYFKNKDEKYCLKLCESIEKDLEPLHRLKKEIEGFFYTPSVAEAPSSRATSALYYGTARFEMEEEPSTDRLYEDNARAFAQKYNEFSNLLQKVVKNELELNKYTDDNHNISDELWDKSSLLIQCIAELKKFQNEKRTFSKQLNYIPAELGGVLKIMGRSLNGIYTHGIYAPYRGVYNYITSNPRSAISAVVISASGAYAVYQSYNFVTNFVTSDYSNIALQIVIWGGISYSIYKINKIFKQSSQESHSEVITLTVNASTQKGTLVQFR